LHPLDILFWACLMLGGGYTLFTLLMGGFSHAVGHAAHIGDALHVPHIHDLVGHGHAGEAAGGHASHASQAGHVDSAHHHGDSHQQLESEGGRFNVFQYLNPMSVAGFLLGFGGGGIVSGLLFPGGSSGARLVSGALSGWALWLIAYLIATRLFGDAEGTSHNRREDVIGLRATVNAPISGLRPGMVSYVVGGTRQSLRAVTDDEESIPVGAQVRIRRITNNTANVMRIDSPDVPEAARLHSGS